MATTVKKNQETRQENPQQSAERGFLGSVTATVTGRGGPWALRLELQAAPALRLKALCSLDTHQKSRFAETESSSLLQEHPSCFRNDDALS